MNRPDVATTPMRAAAASPQTDPTPPAASAVACRARQLEFRHPGRRPGEEILCGVDIDVPTGRFTTVIGTNGCGKSTLLRLLCQRLHPTGGQIWLGDDPLDRLSARDIARRMAVMHQSLAPLPGLRVAQLVAQGRFAHRGPLGMLSRTAEREGAEALATVGMTDAADRMVDTLSGGERQRVRLALALAQQAPVLLLDEPTAHLDLHHQMSMLDLVRRVQEEQALTVLAVLHDLDHAARYADHVIALGRGAVQAAGTPRQVITEDLLARLFAVEGRVTVSDGGALRVRVDAPLPARPRRPG